VLSLLSTIFKSNIYFYLGASGGMFLASGRGSAGCGFGENNQGPDPSFPPSNTPDFLSSLSQMGDNLIATDKSGGGGSHPRTPLDGQMCNPRTPADVHMGHPRTPIDGQLGYPQTPMDGPSCHPRTPMDGQLCHPRTPMDGQSCHPRTPMDGQLCYSAAQMDSLGMTSQSDAGHTLLRHPSSGPGTPGSFGNPRTPASNGSNHRTTDGVGGGRNNVDNNSNIGSNNAASGNNAPSSNGSSTGSMNGFTSNYSQMTGNSQQPQSQQPQSTASVDLGFDSDIGFHTPSLIDGETSNTLDVSGLIDVS